ncbi:MAG: hypothetical protein QOK04_1656 [Solirubrobacteraceae bacterium]|nr:hypothetical protein [Solirubrobacteraceae bacterium]
MGLLDEAIKEHLDLKRRRGDDPAEVARLEREALGPAVRQPEPAQVADEAPADPDRQTAAQAGESAVDEVPAAPEEAGQATAPFDPAQAFEEDHSAAAAPTEVAPAPPTEPPATEPAPPEPPPAAVEPAAPAAPPDTERAPEPPPEPAAEPPAEKPRTPAGEEGEEGEDVLEETPEFLQETPDHDRLWFEQKPPRDFDFDG